MVDHKIIAFLTKTFSMTKYPAGILSGDLRGVIFFRNNSTQNALRFHSKN